MTLYPASYPGTVFVPGLAMTDAGTAQAPDGIYGCAITGPHVPAQAGVYRVTMLTRSIEDRPRALSAEVFSEGRVYGTSEFSAQGNVVVYLPDTLKLEFKIFARGLAFIHEGVVLEPLLLTREEASRCKIEELIVDLTDERANAEPIFHLIERLAVSEGPEAARVAVQRYIAANQSAMVRFHTAYSSLHSRARTAWGSRRKRTVRALTSRRSLSQALVTSISRYLRPSGLPEGFDLPLTLDQVREAMAAMPITRVQLQPYRDQDHGAGQHAEIGLRGYEHAFLQASRLSRSFNEPRRSWQKDPGPGDSPAVMGRPAAAQALANVDLSFEVDLAKGKGMLAYCPVSGRELRSFHGFALFYKGTVHSFYRFEGAEVFYVCTGQYINSRMIMFMPKTGTLVVMEEEELAWYHYEDLVREFMSSVIFHWRDVAEFLTQKPKLACVYGIQNIGHFFWNEMSGLYRASQCELLGNFSELVAAPTQYLDSRELIPELARLRRSDVDDPAALFSYCVRNGLTPVRFTDGVITPQFLEQIQGAARKHASPQGTPPSDSPRPLIWINVRAHNKIWLDQVEGYAKILNALYDEYGSAAALIQGLPDCRGIYDGMRALTRPEIPLYDGLDQSIHDKISWAGKVDAYICVAGAGLAFTTWLADVPGVAHSEHAHLDHLSWWHWVRPGSKPPLSPPRSAVTEVGSGAYCNYRVDWRVLLDLLREALSQRCKQ